MRKLLAFITIFIFALILTPLLALTMNEPLQVMQALPQGVIEGDPGKKDITVFFNKSMSALEAIPAEQTNLFQISPNVPGKFRWKNNSTLVFTPDIPLPYATRFTITIPTSLKALDGSALSQPYSWTFETRRPEVTATSPTNGENGVALSPIIHITFNQPVKPETIKPFIKVISMDKGSTMPFNLSWLNDRNKNIVDVVLPSKLEVGKTYKVVVAQGLIGSEGPLGMETTKESVFSTYGEFKFVSINPPGTVDPERWLSLKFTNLLKYQYGEMKEEELVSIIKIEPAAELRSAWMYANDELGLNYNLKADTNYKITISGSLKDKFGQTLGKDEVVIFKTSHRESKVGFKEGFGVLESYLDKKVSIDLMNVQSLDIKKANIPLEDVISVYRGRYSSVNWTISGNINTNSVGDKKNIFPIDLSDVIKGNSGIAALTITPHGNNFSYTPQTYEALYNVTNIGITAKFSPYSGLLWVTHLKDSTPVSGAEIELRSEAMPSKVLWKGVTDSNGFVYTPGRIDLDVGDTLWAFVRHPDGIAFVASGWDWGIQPYRFGYEEDDYRSYNYNPQELAGDIFTDRGLYKPGDEVQIKGIIREKHDKGWMIPQITGGKLTVYESSYDTGDKIVYSDDIVLSTFGTFNRTIKLKEEIPAYNRLYVTFAPEGKDQWKSNNILRTSFQVATFRPVTFKTEVQPMQDTYTVGDELMVKVKGSYLFGAPLKGADVSWTISRQPTYYEPPHHEGYVFGSYFTDYYDNERSIYSTVSGNGKLDDNGNIDVKAKIDYPSNLGAAQCAIEARVSDSSKQEISGRNNVLIHPGDFYIGLKKAKSFIKEKEEVPVDVITVFPNGEFSNNQSVKVSLIKREWKSARKLTSYGEYQWVSDKQDTVVDEQSIVTGGASSSVVFKPQKAGYYLISATAADSKGRKLMTTSYLYVTGSSYAGWYMDNDDRIEIVSDKDNYKPGDTAQILVKSPYQEVDALVTVEREGVIDHWITKLHGSADSINIPIKNEYLPNVYVSVILIKGRIGVNMFNEDNQDIGKPAFKIGYINLPVSPAEKKLSISIKPSGESFKPGSMVSADIDVKDSNGKGVISEVSVAVVDEGVLNLINYNIPDPFDIFYAIRPLSVTTAETRHHIIGQRVYGEKGGGGGAGDGEGYQPITYSMSDLRKDFRYTAYWLPAVMTNADGKAHITFKLPDSITSYRIMAVANTLSSSFGSGKTAIKSRKPLMLSPVLPRFIRVNDEIEAGVMVYNYTGHQMDVNLQAVAQGLIIKGDSTGKYRIPSGDMKLVRFTYNAPAIPASATITFVAKESNGTESDGVSVTIPIVKANPKETVGFFGNTDNSALEKVKIPDTQGSLSVSMTSTALSGLSGTVEYLFEYPYGCLEQTISRMLPMILFGDTVDSFGLPTIPGGKYREVVQTNLDKIKLFQKYDGSFGIWQDSRYSDPYISAYTVFALIEAQKYGYRIDQSVLDKGLEYMKTVLRQTTTYPYSEYELNTVKCFALYTLSDKGMYDPSYAQYLYERRASLPFFARAYLLMAIADAKGNETMQAELRRELMNGLVFEGGIAHIEEPAQFNSYWLFSSDARSTAAVLMAIMKSSEIKNAAADESFSKKVMDKLSKVAFLKKFVKAEGTQEAKATDKTQDAIVISMVRWLSEKAKGGRWRSTQENLFVFWALGTYSKMYEAEIPNFTASADMGNGIKYDAKFAGKSLKVNKKELPLTLFKSQEMVNVNIKKAGDGMLFYKLQMDYVPKGVLPPLNEGIGVVKSYYTIDGKPVTGSTFKLGDIYRVDVQLTTDHERSYVVMESLLPSGFEPINTSFATESQVVANALNDASQNEMYSWWYSPFNKVEMWDDRIVVFSNYLPKGTSTYSYLVRATIPGRFYTPPDHAEMMYYPEIFGRTSGSNLEIK